jgi:hypothetical protein
MWAEGKGEEKEVNAHGMEEEEEEHGRMGGGGGGERREKVRVTKTGGEEAKEKGKEAVREEAVQRTRGEQNEGWTAHVVRFWHGRVPACRAAGRAMLAEILEHWDEAALRDVIAPEVSTPDLELAVRDAVSHRRRRQAAPRRVPVARQRPWLHAAKHRGQDVDDDVLVLVPAGHGEPEEDDEDDADSRPERAHSAPPSKDAE